VSPTSDVLSACDLAIIVTNHSAFDYLQIVRNAPVVFDTRNATEGMKAKNLVRL
jgi:UDP-N-acetyl-D-glucosamine dehydrogenase